MYRFSFVNNIAGKAQEMSRQLFHEIIAREDVKRICENIAKATSAEEVGKLKRSLPALCWHAWFDDGKRKNYAAHASGLIMLDLDHVEDPRGLFEQVKSEVRRVTASPSSLSSEEGAPSGEHLYIRGHLLLAAHITPSTKGLRLVFTMPEGVTDIVAAQAMIVKDLGLKNVDACTKDLARLSFCVPKDYWLYVDEEGLFGGPTPLPPSVDREGEQDSNVCDAPIDKEDDEVRFTEGVDKGMKSTEGGYMYPEDYNGIGYKVLVECLQELLGGIPAHGSRNNFIFSMAAYLRYVCDDDPEWIASILPTYGEARDKWRRTIDSACQRAQYKQMPQIVKRAIGNARKRVIDDGGMVLADGEQDMPPQMPEKLPKLIKHLTKNVPEVCRPSVANAVFPALAAHLNGVKFWLIDGTEKEATFMCVTMAKQSSGKSAVNKPIEYIVADIVERDELNRKREQDWKDACANKGANKEKPKRPDDLCVQVLVSDMTNAAFVQRMKDANGRYLYTNLEELDLLKQLQTNGTKDVGKIICLCFDNGKYGQERVGTQSVTARVDLRWNWNASSTILKGVQFFKGRMVDGTLSRVNFCTIIPDKTKPFVYGRYDEKYAEDLKPFITNLNLATGYIECKQALELAKRLEEECADEGVLSDDDVYLDLAHRAVTIAYLKAMVLYIANDMAWTKEIAEFVEWSLKYDLWCKCHFFGELVSEEKAKENVKIRLGRKNMLDLLPDSFTVQEATDVRIQQGMEGDARQMVYLWVHRGYVEKDETGRYVKTEEYLGRVKK